MPIDRNARGSYELAAAIPVAQVAELVARGQLASVSIGRGPEIGVHHARRLAALKVDHLWLWRSVTRPALRHLLDIHGLRVLEILRLGVGKLPGFQPARSLEVLRMNDGLSEHDLLRIAQCAGLCELCAQGAQLTRRALAALLALPGLTALDLESTPFDDAMARQLRRSTTLASLDIGATRITRVALRHLVTMPSLRALDLWATALDSDDLQLLRELPQLEYVSLGGHAGSPVQLDPKAVTALLLQMPGLRKVWLDGVPIDAAQAAALRAKIGTVQVTD